jgi:glycosyltransferase involved in cell wall biosynthesis
VRIAVVGRYPRDPAHIQGGVEAVTLRLARGLARLPDVEVHAVVSEPDWPVESTRDEGVTVHSVGGARRFGNVTFSRGDRRRIAGKLRELQPDVAHAHSVHREALGAIESGLPTVVTIHGMIEDEIRLQTRLSRRARGWFRTRLVDQVFRRMRNVIVLSPTVGEHYASRLRHARVWTIENPVDELFFEQTGEASPHTLLFSGFLIHRKGLRNLLEAFRRAKEKRPEAKLRLAGRGTEPEYEAELRALVAREGLEDAVSFLGALAPETLAGEIAGAAAIVLVSRQETLPVAIQEAMAVGRPVIASPVGGVPSIVRDGETGFLVEHGDPDALAERFVAVMDDADLRRRMGDNARRLAEERFRPDSVCRRTLAVYREVIEGGER